ncbi:MAG TPA: NADP-dependent oxidoreductase [Pirellulales bacterium]
MRAFVLTKYGGRSSAIFRDVPQPKPAAHEVLVKVNSAGLNPVDYKFRQSKLWPVYHPKLPVVMGNELAGTVVECGIAAQRFAVGDRIFVRGHKAQLGAFAEFAAVPEELAAKVPDRLDFVAAGGVPLAGLTALQVLRDELQIKSGQRLLITGGAGGVGTFAIQLAKWMGAEVWTTASAAGAALVKSLGTDHVIDYTRQAIEKEVQNLDGVFDTIGGQTLRQSFRVVRTGGKVVSIAGTPEPTTARKDLGRGPALTALFWLASFRLRCLAWRHSVQYRYYFMHGNGADLAQLAQLIDEGRLRVVVDRVFDFDRIQEAFAYLEQGHAKGKVIVLI